MSDANAFVWRMCNDATNVAIEAIETAALNIWAAMQCYACPNPDAAYIERMYWVDDIARKTLVSQTEKEAGFQIWRSMEMIGRPDGDYAECMNGS